MISYILALVPMCALFLAGVVKSFDSALFAQEISSWHILPHWASAPLGVMLPACEVGIASAWFFSPRSRNRWAICAIVFLIFVTAAYALEWVVAEAPPCTCFGMLSRYQRFQARAGEVVLRNVALVVMLAASLRVVPEKPVVA